MRQPNSYLPEKQIFVIFKGKDVIWIQNESGGITWVWLTASEVSPLIPRKLYNLLKEQLRFQRVSSTVCDWLYSRLFIWREREMGNLMPRLILLNESKVYGLLLQCLRLVTAEAHYCAYACEVMWLSGTTSGHCRLCTYDVSSQSSGVEKIKRGIPVHRPRTFPF